MVRWTIAPTSGHAMEGVPWAFVAKQDSEAMKVASGRRGPQSLRSAGLGCAIRGGLSFGDFSLAAQRKVTCRGSATHKYTRPQTARLRAARPAWRMKCDTTEERDSG